MDFFDKIRERRASFSAVAWLGLFFASLAISISYGVMMSSSIWDTLIVATALFALAVGTTALGLYRPGWTYRLAICLEVVAGVAFFMAVEARQSIRENDPRYVQLAAATTAAKLEYANAKSRDKAATAKFDAAMDLKQGQRAARADAAGAANDRADARLKWEIAKSKQDLRASELPNPATEVYRRMSDFLAIFGVTVTASVISFLFRALFAIGTTAVLTAIVRVAREEMGVVRVKKTRGGGGGGGGKDRSDDELPSKPPTPAPAYDEDDDGLPSNVHKLRPTSADRERVYAEFLEKLEAGVVDVKSLYRSMKDALPDVKSDGRCKNIIKRAVNDGYVTFVDVPHKKGDGHSRKYSRGPKLSKVG